MAVLAFHSLASVPDLSQYDLETDEDRQTRFVRITRGKQITKRYTLRKGE